MRADEPYYFRRLLNTMTEAEPYTSMIVSKVCQKSGRKMATRHSAKARWLRPKKLCFQISRMRREAARHLSRLV